MARKSNPKKKPTSSSLTIGDLISLADAAKIYGFDQTYLRQLIHRGRLQAQKIGRNWITSRSEMEKYIASRQERGAYRDDITT